MNYVKYYFAFYFKISIYIEIKISNQIPRFSHTHATNIFSTGASKAEDAYIVVQRLGHSVKYSLDTYGDLYKEREKEVLKSFKFL